MKKQEIINRIPKIFRAEAIFYRSDGEVNEFEASLHAKDRNAAIKKFRKYKQKTMIGVGTIAVDLKSVKLDTRGY
jgi:hypothetical protein